MNNATEVFQPLQADDPPVVAGYRLAARLGAGGMGRVYLSHTQGGRPVAIKVVRPELADDPDFRRRFRREVEAARRVRGAYTAELIDADADGVPPWLATLYVPGPSLAEAVARRGPLPVPAVLWLVAGVAEALQAIHGAGIVHRDLKPSNVLLAADGPRVIDFGISLAADATSHTATGFAVGTPQFMAPEQATADEVTEATDVFALGQTAAFAALGRPLYGDGPAATVLYRIVHQEPDLSPLPEQLRRLIARCLVTDREERATLAEVVEWCRQGLGTDADAGAGPAVWREVTGPEVTVPSPVPSPVPDPTRVLHSAPLVVTGPQPQPQSTVPDARRTRRGRTALITTAAVTAGVLVLSGFAWMVSDAGGRFRDWVAGAPSTPGPKESEGSSTPESSAGSPSASGHGSGAGDGTSDAAQPSPTASKSPQAVPYPLQRLDAKSSLSFKEPVQREDRKGDIRFDCKDVGCALDSDTSVFVQLFGASGASLDECRLLLASADRRRWPLAGAANGSQICVKHSSGDIALLVLQTKSTALPELAFLQLDMTIWREAA
ncbi:MULTISPECIES: serine/threonine-protein kinase [unclassified Streptomyces]|uniref:serine/threonine-protein kinase n=1 Tax=unclassified Streptomyces TaxID=2593676 RepID=UPI002365BA0F|nr:MULTISPECIES: serine/threonine-protein kinase [unclassified Streptomyces]MDF3141332.1 serine/threonine-protein kinase [Streptomyces sp. T21Q-yed]WDF42402.1 serine/threonine-protein kinase [Streptomyces sp. T12]